MSFLSQRLARAFRPVAARRFASSFAAHSTRKIPYYRSVACVAGVAGVAAYFTFAPQHVYLDSQVPELDEVEAVVDPATSISFPRVMTVSKGKGRPNIPLSLVGVGVRTVSFLGIKVYSVGFYADLVNPNLKVPLDMSAEEKVDYIVKNTTCAIRIVPTRSTSFTHLRDAFIRALQARLSTGAKDGTVTEQIAQSAASPIRKLKGLFPNSSIAKHTPFDIVLAEPAPGRPRALIFRDLGSIEDDWVATELVLHYFEGLGPSPPLKVSVLENLQTYSS